jgi:hypothetical protein
MDRIRMDRITRRGTLEVVLSVVWVRFRPSDGHDYAPLQKARNRA